MTNPPALNFEQAHVVAEWPHDRPLCACRFDPNGRYAFCGAEAAHVVRFDLSDGSRTLLDGGHDTWVLALAFSKDGQHVVSGGCDGRITWWETAAEAPAPVRSVEAHHGWIRSLDVSPDGAMLASGGNDHLVRLWDTADGTLIRELAGHESHVYSVAFHPDGRSLFSGDLTGVLKQWDTATGSEARTFEAKQLHSYNTGQRVDFGGIRAIAVSPNGKWLAAGGLHKASNPLGSVHEPLVLLFDCDTQQTERQHIAEGITHGVVWRLRWLADGTLSGVCGGGSGGFLLFWRPEADNDAHRFRLPSLARDMDLHPDGVRAATAHYDRHLRITRLTANVDSGAE